MNKCLNLLEFVYLAGPLENVSNKKAMGWRDKCKQELCVRGNISSLIPGFDTTLNDAKTIVILDFLMIEKVKAVLINLTYLGTNTVGTGSLIELGYARKAGKLIVGYSELPWKKENRFLRGILDQLFKTREEAVAYLVGFNDRKRLI